MNSDRNADPRMLAGEIQAIADLFDAEPDFAAAEARTFVGTYTGDDVRRFWTAPAGFFPAHNNLPTTFSEVYARRLWGDGSGAGSNFEYTLLYAGYIQHLIRSPSVRSIVDLGCGDWRFSRYLALGDCDYVGIDVVPAVVAANTTAYGAARVRFVCADITTYSLPPCDLLLCKDVLQHLSNTNAAAVLSRISEVKAALVTNDFHPVNHDCANGDTRPLNPMAAPFYWQGEPRLAFHGKVSFLARR